MIDWVSVGFGTLWVLGLGIVTATISFAYYLASQNNQRFKRVMEIPACHFMINLGLILFCVGVAGGVSEVWERLLWAVMALMFMFQIWQARKNRNA